MCKEMFSEFNKPEHKEIFYMPENIICKWKYTWQFN